MTEIATIDWFGRWGTSVFSENTVILPFFWRGEAGDKFQQDRTTEAGVTQR